MSMARFITSHEVGMVMGGGWKLLLQWGAYHYKNGDAPQYGYRFIWKGRRGLQSRPARIPNAKTLSNLLKMAKAQGWFLKCERERRR
jgi:hypothetical protein